MYTTNETFIFFESKNIEENKSFIHTFCEGTGARAKGGRGGDAPPIRRAVV